MALLTSPLFVAVSMVIALAMIGRPTDSALSILSCVGSLLCTHDKRIERIKAKPRDMRSFEDSKLLAKDCVERLEKNTENGKHDEVRSIIKDLVEVLQQEGDLNWNDIGLKADWKYPLFCWLYGPTEDVGPIKTISDRARYRDKDVPHFELSLLCFKRFLEHYGYETKYQKALRNMEKMSHKLWDPEKYPTLDSYFMDEFWAMDQKENPESRVKMVLNVINELPTMASVSSQTVSQNEKLGDLLTHRLFTTNSVPQFQKLVKDQFALFLDKSGLEERFKKVMKQHNIDLDNVDSPLANYLSTKENAPKIIYSLKMINELSNLDRTYVSTISNERDIRFHYVELNPDFNDDPFADIVKAHNFKKIAKKHSLHKIKKLANAMESEISSQHRDDPRKSRTLVEFIFPGVITRIAGDDIRAFIDGLLAECSSLIPDLLPSMVLMNYDFATAKNDKEIMDIMNYLGYCPLLINHYEKRLSDEEKWLGEIFDILNAPYYPTRVQALNYRELRAYYKGKNSPSGRSS